MKCTNCGENINQNMKFCGNCGFNLKGILTQPQIANNISHKSSNKRFLFWVVGGAILIATIFWVGMLLFNRPDFSLIHVTSEEVQAEKSLVLGDILYDGVQIDIPSGALNVGDTVELSVTDSMKNKDVDYSYFDLVANPIDISLSSGEPTWLKEPMTITFQIDESKMNTIEDESFLRLGYYYDGEWFLYPIKSFDSYTGIVSSELNHFSIPSPVNLTKNGVHQELAKDLAIVDWEIRNNRKAITAATSTHLGNLIKTVTGLEDPQVIKAMLDGIGQDNDFVNLVVTADKKWAEGTNVFNGDAGFQTKLGEIIIEKLTKTEDFGNEMTALTATTQALTSLYEKDPKAAMEQISDAILSTNAFGKALKAGIAVTDASIKSWKASGLEDMYNVYKNGSSGRFGFNAVEKGDFQTIITLAGSSGVIRQVRIDAVKEYCRVEGIVDCNISEGERVRIGDEAVKKLQNKFDDRISEEKDINERQKYYEKLFAEFEKYKIDQMVRYRLGNDNLTYEERLNRYLNVMNNILKITNTKVTFAAFKRDGQITSSDLAIAISRWYQEPVKENGILYLLEKGYLTQEEANKLLGIETIPLEVNTDSDFPDDFYWVFKESYIIEERAEDSHERYVINPVLTNESISFYLYDEIRPTLDDGTQMPLEYANVNYSWTPFEDSYLPGEEIVIDAIGSYGDYYKNLVPLGESSVGFWMSQDYNSYGFAMTSDEYQLSITSDDIGQNSVLVDSRSYVGRTPDSYAFNGISNTGLLEITIHCWIDYVGEYRIVLNYEAVGLE